MKNFLPVLALLSAGMATSTHDAIAETGAATPDKKAAKSAPKKAPAKSSNAAKQSAAQTRVDFNCELGRKVSIYEYVEDDKRIGLRWGKKMHNLTRVETSTGAHRFEDKTTGLVWINIPDKGMLLDSKKGTQLANECRKS